jgi:calcineurin-like phosphoesterase family protein
MNEIIGKAACSAYIDSTKTDIDQVLWPELRDCKVIVVANKQRNDAVYFSGIDVDQLIFFLKRMNYPGELVFFVEESRSKLDHLKYDVGFDYKMEGQDLMILKSAYYGFF